MKPLPPDLKGTDKSLFLSSSTHSSQKREDETAKVLTLSLSRSFSLSPLFSTNSFVVVRHLDRTESASLIPPTLPSPSRDDLEEIKEQYQEALYYPGERILMRCLPDWCKLCARLIRSAFPRGHHTGNFTLWRSPHEQFDVGLIDDELTLYFYDYTRAMTRYGEEKIFNERLIVFVAQSAS
jgi:hypothetical protein